MWGQSISSRRSGRKGELEPFENTSQSDEVTIARVGIGDRSVPWFIMADEYPRTCDRQMIAVTRFRVLIRVFVLVLLAFGTEHFPAVAAAPDYDGKWEFENTCSAATGVSPREPFAIQLPATIENGLFSVVYTGIVNGTKVEDNFSGTIEGSDLTIFMDGQSASGEKWHETLGDS